MSTTNDRKRRERSPTAVYTALAVLAGSLALLRISDHLQQASLTQTYCWPGTVATQVIAPGTEMATTRFAWTSPEGITATSPPTFTIEEPPRILGRAPDAFQELQLGRSPYMRALGLSLLDLSYNPPTLELDDP